MSRATWIATALRNEGLRVVEHPGWQRRGSARFSPQGVVCHHTASRAGSNAPALGIVVDGRSDLRGPLAQIVLARDGTCIVVAAGRANHAGLGGFRGLKGNSSVFGIEAENDGRGEAWSAAQIDAYPRVVAALLRRIGRDARWCCGHREWAPNRKIDPAGIDMKWMREAVAAVLRGDPPPSMETELGRPDSGPRVLGRGDVGDDVRAWQRRLVALGEHVAVDGDFGPLTEAATKRLQRRLGLVADGLVGPVTRAAADRAEAAAARRADPDAMLILRRGDEGPAVRRWQESLVASGERLSIDGDFGPKTEAATRRLQQRLGVAVDGVVGPVTRAALLSSSPTA